MDAQQTRLLYAISRRNVIRQRRYREQLPAFLSQYSGNTLWALLLYLLVTAMLAGRPIATRASVALALAYFVEISQLYHSPWIDGIRHTTLGGLVHDDQNAISLFEMSGIFWPCCISYYGTHRPESSAASEADVCLQPDA